MAKVNKGELAVIPTRLGDRLIGKTIEFGPAKISIRALTTHEDTLVGVLAGRAGELGGLAVIDARCRLGITGWEMKYTDGEAIPFETQPLGHTSTRAVPQRLIDLIPIEARIKLNNEIAAMDLDDGEERRLDFTLPLASEMKA